MAQQLGYAMERTPTHLQCALPLVPVAHAVQAFTDTDAHATVLSIGGIGLILRGLCWWYRSSVCDSRLLFASTGCREGEDVTDEVLLRDGVCPRCSLWTSAVRWLLYRSECLSHRAFARFLRRYQCHLKSYADLCYTHVTLRLGLEVTCCMVDESPFSRSTGCVRSRPCGLSDGTYEAYEESVAGDVHRPRFYCWSVSSQCRTLTIQLPRLMQFTKHSGYVCVCFWPSMWECVDWRPFLSVSICDLGLREVVRTSDVTHCWIWTEKQCSRSLFMFVTAQQLIIDGRLLAGIVFSILSHIGAGSLSSLDCNQIALCLERHSALSLVGSRALVRTQRHFSSILALTLQDFKNMFLRFLWCSSLCVLLLWQINETTIMSWGRDVLWTLGTPWTRTTCDDRLRGWVRFIDEPLSQSKGWWWSKPTMIYNSVRLSVFWRWSMILTSGGQWSFVFFFVAVADCGSDDDGLTLMVLFWVDGRQREIISSLCGVSVFG